MKRTNRFPIPSLFFSSPLRQRRSRDTDERVYVCTGTIIYQQLLCTCVLYSVHTVYGTGTGTQYHLWRIIRITETLSRECRFRIASWVKFCGHVGNYNIIKMTITLGINQATYSHHHTGTICRLPALKYHSIHIRKFIPPTITIGHNSTQRTWQHFWASPCSSRFDLTNLTISSPEKTSKRPSHPTKRNWSFSVIVVTCNNSYVFSMCVRTYVREWFNPGQCSNTSVATYIVYVCLCTRSLSIQLPRMLASVRRSYQCIK